jgi:hypothetical protein
LGRDNDRRPSSKPGRGDERRALDGLDRVLVVFDNRGDQRLVETVRRRHHDVQARAVDAQRAWPRASLSLSADIHLSVLNNSYDRVYL